MGILVNSFLSTSKTAISPLSIPGCELWLDATTGLYDASNNPVTTNGAAIARWDDRSGNGHSFTQTTPLRRPTLATNSTNGMNGVGFSYTSLARYLDGGQICNLTGPESVGGNLIAKNYYVCIVFKFDTAGGTGSYQTVLSKTGGYSGAQPGEYRIRRWDYQTLGFTPPQVNRFCMRLYTNGFHDFGVGNFNTTSPMYTLFSIPKVSGRSPYNLTIDVNDTTVASQANTDTNNIPSTNTLQRLFLGIETYDPAFVPDEGTAFNGKIYEVIIYKRTAPLTLKETTSLRRYIKNKWNI